MSFKMEDYVDVAERIREFSKKHPQGSLQSELTRLDGGWLCKAYAYRDATDERPGIGHAFEPVPGKTPYTKDSEAMNAETSAWGRAIVALGFDTKKIASRQEVQARQDSGHTLPGPSTGNKAAESSQKASADAGSSAAASSQFGRMIPQDVQEQLASQPAQQEREQPDDGGDPAKVQIHFGKNQGKRLGDLSPKQVAWYADQWTPNPQYEDAQDRRLKGAALILTHGETAQLPADPDDGIPF